jgi:hypothetical protein
MEISRTPTPATLPTITIPAPTENSTESIAESPRIRRHLADRTRTPDIASAHSDKPLFGEHGIALSDVIDILNPLQHIPFVSSLYRELTGDTISPTCNIIGGTLMGGPIGLIGSVCDTVIAQEQGKGVGDSLVAMLSPADSTQTQIADANTTAPIKTANASTETPAVALATSTASTLQLAANTTGNTIIDLYGASAPSFSAADTKRAKNAYQSADMLSYLKHASVNTVM